MAGGIDIRNFCSFTRPGPGLKGGEKLKGKLYTCVFVYNPETQGGEVLNGWSISHPCWQDGWRPLYHPNWHQAECGQAELLAQLEGRGLCHQRSTSARGLALAASSASIPRCVSSQSHGVHGGGVQKYAHREVRNCTKNKQTNKQHCQKKVSQKVGQCEKQQPPPRGWMRGATWWG